MPPSRMRRDCFCGETFICDETFTCVSAPRQQTDSLTSKQFTCAAADATIVVMPCYNEERRLDVAAVESFIAQHQDIKFLLVDDGSRDRTYEMLAALHESQPERIAVLRLLKNQGKAEAVRQGMQMAFQVEPAIVGFWDADMATPLHTIVPMSTLLKSNDRIHLVMGARVQLLGRTIVRRPLRHYLGRVGATLISWILHLAVYDTQCGAKLFRVNEVTRQVFDEPFLTRWLFDVEIIARFVRTFVQQEGRFDPGERIVEFPLDAWKDVAGSKVRPGDFWRAGWELYRISRRYDTRIPDTAEG